MTVNTNSTSYELDDDDNIKFRESEGSSIEAHFERINSLRPEDINPILVNIKPKSKSNDVIGSVPVISNVSEDVYNKVLRQEQERTDSLAILNNTIQYVKTRIRVNNRKATFFKWLKGFSSLFIMGMGLYIGFRESLKDQDKDYVISMISFSISLVKLVTELMKVTSRGLDFKRLATKLIAYLPEIERARYMMTPKELTIYSSHIRSEVAKMEFTSYKKGYVADNDSDSKKDSS